MFQIDQIDKLKKNQIQIQKLFSFNERLFKRICTCGKVIGLNTYEHIQTLERKTAFQNSYMCELRFCTLCNFYRVKNLSPQIVRVLRELKDAEKELLFLTFTVPNCEFLDLRKIIQRMNSAFNLMSRNKGFKNNVTHWIRTLEVTFKSDQAHPHFHSIFAVDKEYFKHDNYLRTKDWSKMWSRCYKSDQGLIVDARAIRSKDNEKDAILSATAELSKYVIKSTDLNKLTTETMEIIYKQLYRLRFILTSRNIVLDESKEEDLDVDLWKLVESIVYRWNQEEKKYKAGTPQIYI